MTLYHVGNFPGQVLLPMANKLDLLGGPAFPGSGIEAESPIQIAVRDPACIIGVFRPIL